MKLLSRDEFATAIKELVVENFGSEEAFIKMWNDNIDAQEALEKEQEQI
jgi:protoheme ferro-lyase